MTTDEPDFLREIDGSISLIDREELESTAAIIAGLLLSGSDELHNLATDEWEEIFDSTSPAFALKVAGEAAVIVADLQRSAANWLTRRRPHSESNDSTKPSTPNTPNFL